MFGVTKGKSVIVKSDEVDAVVGHSRSRCCRRRWVLYSYCLRSRPFLDQGYFHVVVCSCFRKVAKPLSLDEVAYPSLR